MTEWWHTAQPEQIVTVHWVNHKTEWWNETCAIVLEVFGLPGHRFYYKPAMDFMTFTFKTVNDAAMCRILLSDRI